MFSNQLSHVNPSNLLFQPTKAYRSITKSCPKSVFCSTNLTVVSLHFLIEFHLLLSPVVNSRKPQPDHLIYIQRRMLLLQNVKALGCPTPISSTTSEASSTATSIALTTPAGLIRLPFKTVVLVRPVVANLLCPQDHRDLALKARVTILGHITIIYILITIIINSTFSSSVRETHTAGTCIIMSIMLLSITQHATTISHIGLVCSFCEQDHVLKRLRTVHKSLSSYMGL